MARWLIYFLFCLSAPLLGDEISLKQKFSMAEPGSYLVTEQNKTFTLLYIRENNESTMIIDEISIPAARFASCRMHWKEWFECGSPYHTSWILSQIELATGKIIKTYSLSRCGWIDHSHENHFMTTLFNLHFQSVSERQRRKVGLPPGYGKPDHRPLWNPRLFFEGKPIPEVSFTVWRAQWPADGSELARKWIEVYFAEQTTTQPSYPTYFPYWLEVEGKIGSAKLRVVDSGKGAHSPNVILPECFHPQPCSET